MCLRPYQIRKQSSLIVDAQLIWTTVHLRRVVVMDQMESWEWRFQQRPMLEVVRLAMGVMATSCPGPYDPTPIDDKFPFLTFGGLNDEIGVCKEDDTMSRADDSIPWRGNFNFAQVDLDHVPGEDGFGLSNSDTGIGAMTAEEIRSGIL